MDRNKEETAADAAKDDDALRLKEEGNALFRRHLFAQAASCYGRAIDVLGGDGPDDGDGPGRKRSRRSTSPTSTACTDGAGNGNAIENDGADSAAESEHQRLRLCAVLHSNRSNCLFELGKYREAAQDAVACVDILGAGAGAEAEAEHVNEGDLDAKAEDLLCKNLFRLARALHYGNSNRAPGRGDSPQPVAFARRDGSAKGQDEKKDGEEMGEGDRDSPSVASVLRRLRDRGHGTYSEKAATMLEQIQYYSTPSWSASATAVAADDQQQQQQRCDQRNQYRPSPLRANLGSPYAEYYPFGHDVAESALRNPCVESQSIKLAELLPQQKQPEEDRRLSFLFGGVGDARHVLATLLDAHHQYATELGPLQREGVRLHFTLNDVNAQVLAKDLLVLVLSHHIGHLAPDMRAMHRDREPFLLGVVIMYATLGYAMPPVVHAKLVECVRETFTDSSHGDFCRSYPWLRMSPETWGALVTDGPMAAWVDPEGPGGYVPRLSTVEHALWKIFDPNTQETYDGSLAGLASLGGSSGMISDLLERRKDNAAKKRLAIKEAMTDRAMWSPEMLSSLRDRFGEDLSDEELVKRMMESIDEADDNTILNEGQGKRTLPLDTMFLECTHAILPPMKNCAIQELNEEMRHLFEGECDSEGAIAQKMKRHREVIHETWKVNPVKIDPQWQKYVDGNHAPDKFNPPVEWMQFFYEGAILTYMSEPPTKQDEEGNTLAKSVTRFYWNVGKALKDLEGKVSLEISLGDIGNFGMQILNDLHARESEGLPSEFHRIFLSNVPDYTGLLSMFCSVAPLLAKTTGIITPSLRGNTLLNTGIWKSYDDYVFSTVALTHKQVTRIFGLRVLENEPVSVWDDFVLWVRSDEDATAVPVKYDELRLWLHRLYLMTILPPDRDPFSQIREERANSIDIFLMTCAVCVNVLGYPAHFVSSILDELLGPKPSSPFKTRAALLNSSPSPVPSETCLNKYNLLAFRAELANQIALFMRAGHLPLKVISTLSLPTLEAGCFRIMLKGMDRNSIVFGKEGRPSSSVLGFILEKAPNADFGISGAAGEGVGSNPMLAMMAMMSGGGMGMSQKKSKLRKALLENGDKIGHVFSCAQWDLEKQAVTFCMCEDLFDKYKSYHFSLIRTDGWFRVRHGRVRLCDAERL